MIKNCKNCNNEFKQEYPWQLYCSITCRTECNYKIRKLKGRRGDIVKKFNLSIKEYCEMFLKQDGVCAICFKAEKALSSNKKMIKNLAVDHNHITNTNRGLLCQKCNVMIGNCGDDIEILLNAIRYLKLYTKQNETK